MDEKTVRKITDRIRYLDRGTLRAITANEGLRAEMYDSMIHAFQHYCEEVPRLLAAHPVMAIAYVRKMADIMYGARKIANGSGRHMEYEKMLLKTSLSAREQLPQETDPRYKEMLLDVAFQEASAIQARQNSTPSS